MNQNKKHNDFYHKIAITKYWFRQEYFLQSLKTYYISFNFRTRITYTYIG